MNKDFIEILKKLVNEQGKEALTNPTKCKSLLRDYTKNEFQKETKFIIRAIEAKAGLAIDKADDLVNCKKIQIKSLHEDEGFTPEISVNIVNILALVLRSDETVTEIELYNNEKTVDEEKPVSPSNKQNNNDSTITTVNITSGLPGVESLTKRGRLFLEDSNWKQANEYFDKVLDIDPEYAPAYVGKLCAELNIQHEGLLIQSATFLSENKYFLKAMRYADISYRKKLEEYEEALKKRKNEGRRFQEIYKNIFEAAEKGIVDAIQFFLLNGSDINEKNNVGETPLHMAARYNSNVEVVKYLISQGADIKAENKGRRTPLSYAVMYNPNIDVVKYFISLCEDINAEYDYGNKLINDAACHNSNLEIIKYLISQGADINTKNGSGMTPLHSAAAENPNLEIIKYLISQGINVNQKDKYGRTPFSLSATHNPKIEVVKYLYSLGADVNQKGNYGETPFYKAAGYQTNVEILKYLVSQGADVNVKNNGKTPLHYSASNNSNVDVIKYLVSLGLDINAKDDLEMTPLHYAARYNSNMSVIKCLISLGANVNAKNGRVGETPLHFAVSDNFNADIIKYLVSQGADIYAKDYKGKTPFDKS